MATSRFVADARTSPDGATITLRGQIDIDAERALADAYATIAANGAGTVTLDFSGVGYINSTGIALIVRLLADARRDHREVRARGLSEHYREIFRITRLADYIVLEDEPAAVADGTGGRP